MLLVSMIGQVFAQLNTYKMPTLAEMTFNMSKFRINHRHAVLLDNRNAMQIELFDVADYEVLKDIKTILTDLKNDVAFLKDSIDNLGADNMRLDYQMTDASAEKKIRYTRYPSNGEVYYKKRENISALKLSQDTIRIFIPSNTNKEYCCKSMWSAKKKPGLHEPVQVMLLLNNYSDIDELIANAPVIQHIIDTMAQVSQPQKKKDMVPAVYNTTIFYHWATDKKLILYYGKVENERYPSYYKQRSNITFYGNVGAGLVRNKIAPTAAFGLTYRKPWVFGQKDYNLWSVYASPYFLFEKKADGKYYTYDSWFVNFEVGSSFESDWYSTLTTQKFTVGMGYLLNPNNLHFTGFTMKVFANFTFMKGITVSPELIATDKFKSIFPGVTVKLF